MVQVQTVDVGKGVSWIAAGWRNFTRNPGIWIALGLVFLIVFIVVSMIPLVGGVVASLIAPTLLGGLIFSARESDERRPIELGQLFRGFQQSQSRNALLALGGVAVAGTLVSMGIFFASMGGAMMAGMHGGATVASSFVFGAGGLFTLLLVLAVQLLVTMALVYAVPLVMLANQPAGEAMRASFNACVRNFLPLLLFGAIYLVLGILASLPFGLGWLVLFPASIGMLYASYRDCFSV